MKPVKIPPVFFVWRVAAILACFVPSVSAQAFDKATFEALDQQGRLTRVLAGLEKREQLLQNCSYSLELSTTNVGPNDAHRFMFKEKQEVKRIAEKHLVRDVRFEYYNEHGEITNDTLISWDGHEGRSFARPPYPGSATPLGSVRPADTQTFSSRFSELMGLSMEFRREQFTAPAWLRTAILKSDSVNLSWVEWKGDGAISLLVDDNYVHLKIILDAQHGLMPRHYERVYINKNGVVYNWWTEDADNIQQVGEIWLPKTATIKLGTATYPEVSVVSVKVGDFTSNTVKDKDLRIAFPDGTRVVDTIRNIAYTVMGDSEIDSKPIANPQRERPAEK